MGMVEAVKICFKKYANFSGRARRAEYWWFYLFTLLVSKGGILLNARIFGGSTAVDMIINLFNLAVLIPILAVCSRRLHDIDRSGWLQAFPLVPLFIFGIIFPNINSDALLYALPPIILAAYLLIVALCILLIIMLATQGELGGNRFGEDPLSDDDYL